MAGKSLKEEADTGILAACEPQAAEESIGDREVRKGLERTLVTAMLLRTSLSSNHQTHKSAGIE